MSCHNHQVTFIGDDLAKFKQDRVVHNPRGNIMKSCMEKFPTLLSCALDFCKSIAHSIAW